MVGQLAPSPAPKTTTFFDVTPNLMLKIAQVAQGEYVAPEKLEQIYSKSFYISQVKALFNYYGYYG